MYIETSILAIVLLLVRSNLSCDELQYGHWTVLKTIGVWVKISPKAQLNYTPNQSNA